MRGSLRQRSTGSWTLTYDYGCHSNGRRRQMTETVHGTRRDAERRLAERLHEVDTRRVPNHSQMTFDRLADAFLQARSGRVAATTLDVYERRLRQHIRPVIGQLRIGTLTAEHVEHLLAAAKNRSRTRQKGAALGGGTLRNILITVRACLQCAVRNEWLGRNVAMLVDLPSKCDDREPILFDTETVRRVILAVAGSDICCESAFALGTGVRRGEVCGLQWGDIDLDSGRYTIRRNAVHIKKMVEYRAPKTKRSRRTDVLPPAIRDLLQIHRQEEAAKRESLCLGAVRNESFVFTGPDGAPWKPNELSRQFSRLARKKQIMPMRFHDLRHGHASLAFAAGVPLKIISESLGHSGIAITSEIYVHLLAEAREDKAARIDSSLQPIRELSVAARRTVGNRNN